MCRAEVESDAQGAVAHLLRDIAQAVADQEKVDVSCVRTGPVDLGTPDRSEITA